MGWDALPSKVHCGNLYQWERRIKTLLCITGSMWMGRVKNESLAAMTTMTMTMMTCVGPELRTLFALLFFLINTPLSKVCTNIIPNLQGEKVKYLTFVSTAKDRKSELQSLFFWCSMWPFTFQGSIGPFIVQLNFWFKDVFGILCASVGLGTEHREMKMTWCPSLSSV